MRDYEAFLESKLFTPPSAGIDPRASCSGTAQWTKEGSQHQAMLLADGYEPATIRRFVMASFWAVLMVKPDATIERRPT